MKKSFIKLKESEKGASLLEYALALTLMVIVSIGAVSLINEATKERAIEARKPLENVAPCAPGGSIPCF